MEELIFLPIPINTKERAKYKKFLVTHLLKEVYDSDSFQNKIIVLKCKINKKIKIYTIKEKNYVEFYFTLPLKNELGIKKFIYNEVSINQKIRKEYNEH